MGAQDGIEHVVVLMLENRSFDSMRGMLYPASVDFDGLSGKETNLYHSPDGIVQTIPVWHSADMDAATAAIPDPDPASCSRILASSSSGRAACPVFRCRP